MAEPETEQIGSEGCCSPGAQQACCAPEAKSECCGEAHGSSCGCDAGRSGEAEVRDEADVREMVRERYAGAATAASAEHAASAIVRARLAPDRVPAPREASGDHSGPPIACSLSSGEKGERLDAWRAVAAAALLESSVEERGLSLRLRHDAEAELRRLIAAESSCCPFLDFDLRSDGPDLRLTVAGPGGARPIILTLFGLERLENAEHAWSNG